MLQITSSELKANLGKYMDYIKDDDVFITRNGKVVAKLSAVKKDKVAIAKSLFGAIPNTFEAETALKERRKQI